MDSLNLPPPSIDDLARPLATIVRLAVLRPARQNGAFRGGHEHSASAFEILDRWLDYECVNTLRLGVPGEYESADVPLLGEFGVDSLLTAPVADK